MFSLWAQLEYIIKYETDQSEILRYRKHFGMAV